MAEHLDDLLPVHHLLHVALGAGNGLLRLKEVACGAAADALGDEGHGHDAQHQHQRQPDAEIQHDGKHRQHDGGGLDERGNGLRDELAERVDIIGVIAHDIAVLVRVEELDGQILHPAENLLTELVKEALRHYGHELGIGKLREDGQHVQCAQKHEIGHDLRLRGGPVAGGIPLFDDGEHVLQEDRRNGCDDG